MENSSRLEIVDFLKRFSYENLRSFTNDFDTKIGSGGFGIVYRGEFPNGMPIAVKVLNEEYVTEDLFMDEVRIMGITYHHNLVRFLGYCCDTNKKGLVYEYMENGSLYQILRKKDRCIEWDKLYDIMIETANGISYLHGKRIIHHDVKPANVLLDSNFSPKVADFGLAQLINRDVSHVTVSQVKGTPGYMAPEMYVELFSHVTHKCDIYSFGMMLFDVLGRCNFNQNEKSFVEMVWEGFQKGGLDKIIEDCGIEEKHRERATILSMVALWCSQYTPKTRPEMSDVVKMLKREIQVMTPPNPRLPSQDSTTQLSREGPEDEVSNKEIVDKIPTQADNEDVKAIELESVGESSFYFSFTNFKVESSNNLARYDFVSITERDEIIVKYVMQDHGFSNGIPVAAVLMYKWFFQLCLEYNLNIEADPNAKFDRLVHMIGSAIEQHCDQVLYWLSATSMLIFFLERGFRAQNTSFLSPWSRMMLRIFCLNIHRTVSNIVVCVQEVDFFHPALAFKGSLLDCLMKAYRIIRDKLKEDLRSSLSLCIEAPTTASWRADWRASVASSANISHWQSIISTLNGILKKFQDNHVPPVLASKVFSQAFYYINVQLFNSLMTKHGCHTLNFGEYVKAGLYELGKWCDIGKNYVGSSLVELKHTREAVEFLITGDKYKCHVLNSQQLYTICSSYRGEENHYYRLPADSLKDLRMCWDKDERNGVSVPLFLEDSSDIPLSTDDISRFVGKMKFPRVTLEDDVDIVKHPSYHFLQV